MKRIPTKHTPGVLRRLPQTSRRTTSTRTGRVRGRPGQGDLMAYTSDLGKFNWAKKIRGKMI